jgi:hypothetical protein
VATLPASLGLAQEPSGALADAVASALQQVALVAGRNRVEEDYLAAIAANTAGLAALRQPAGVPDAWETMADRFSQAIDRLMQAGTGDRAPAALAPGVGAAPANVRIQVGAINVTMRPGETPGEAIGRVIDQKLGLTLSIKKDAAGQAATG